MTGLASQALAFHRALAARRVKDAAGTAIGRLSLTRRDACATSSGRRSCGGLFVLGIGIFPYPAIFSLFKLYLGLDFLFAGFFPSRIDRSASDVSNRVRILFLIIGANSDQYIPTYFILSHFLFFFSLRQTRFPLFFCRYGTAKGQGLPRSIKQQA